MIDAGWRVFKGHVPGKDFVVTFPPSLYLLTALFFGLFGVTWPAIAKGDCAIYLLLCLTGLRLGALIRRAHLRSAVYLAVTYIIGQTILLLSINYLWHASLAEAFGTYAALSAYTIMLLINSRSATSEAKLHFTVALAILILSKPNTAYYLLVLCLYLLRKLVFRRRPWGL